MNTSIPTPRGTIILRQAQEADAPAYRELRLEALQNHPQVFSADYATNERQPPTYWTDRLRALGSEGTIYFAVQDDRLIGMCGIQRNNSPKTRHGATIWGVYLQAEWRGLKIAEGLVTNCLDWARDQEIEVVRLGVITTNIAAISCYARCGFQVYGVEPRSILFNDRYYDELLMAHITKENQYNPNNGSQKHYKKLLLSNRLANQYSR